MINQAVMCTERVQIAGYIISDDAKLRSTTMGESATRWTPSPRLTGLPD